MVLFLVGLGLGDERDITVRGLEIVKRCDEVFLEAYTSVLGVDKDRLEEFYGRPITVADRNCVESEADRIYGGAGERDVALLVVGDPFCATTHADLVLRARERGIAVEVVFNASVMGAVAACGLQLYTFGQTVSIPFFTENWRPDSFYAKIAANQSIGLHTLCLLDIKVKEPDFEAMARGRTEFLPPRFMTVNRALEQLVEVEQQKGQGVCPPSALAVGLARLGQPDECIKAGPIEQLLQEDFGAPLHCLVIPAALHEMEEALLGQYRVAEGGTTVAAGASAGVGAGAGASSSASSGEGEGAGEEAGEASGEAAAEDE